MTTPNHIPEAAIPARHFIKAGPLATKIGVHKKTLHRWASAGSIRRFKINERTVLFDEAEVVAYIESAQVA